MIYPPVLEGFGYLESIYHGAVELSRVYRKIDKNQILIVDLQSIFNTEFSYQHYCLTQNLYMNRYTTVFRFLEDDPELKDFVSEQVAEETDNFLGGSFDRAKVSIDPSPLEYRFELCFEEAYGSDALKYLNREYPIITGTGQTGFLDYVLFGQDGSWIVIEENGESYHHPKLIKEKRYRKNLDKQNSVIARGGKLFRWDGRALSNQPVIVDELKNYIGDISRYIVQTSFNGERRLALHDHQRDHLEDLSRDRKLGKNAALVTLPTGTGKTRIACEDIRQMKSDQTGFLVLVLVPSRDLARQWEKEISTYQGGLGQVTILTYAGASRVFQTTNPRQYDYLVVDEAHHSPAPVLKRIIEHFQPGFLLGLTATDQRFDGKKLEEVFSSYQIKMDLPRAIQDGLLAPIRAFRLESNIDLSQVRFNQHDYINADLERRVTVCSRNELIAECLFNFFGNKPMDKQGLVFCVNVQHAKTMANLLNTKGLTASSVDGRDPERDRKIEEYMSGKLQFLCTCSLLTEGWDAPHTSVIVMARPTLSKVLYMQQIGRGTRTAKGKEFLYVIDVVDTYGAFGGITNRPWSIHALFESTAYQPWGIIAGTAPDESHEMAVIDTTRETILALKPLDIFTWQKAYNHYYSTEQLARELFVSTGTVNSWIGKREVQPDLVIPMGRSSVTLFHPDRVPEIRKQKNLKEHNDNTIVEDFQEFLAQGDYTFSFKIFFLLSFLDVMDENGEADFRMLLERYRRYYLDRHDRGITVDRPKCLYNDRNYLLDDIKLKNSILQNPFEKFERKRFMSYAKDLKCLSFHPRLRDYYSVIKNREELRDMMIKEVEKYYKSF